MRDPRGNEIVTPVRKPPTPRKQPHLYIVIGRIMPGRQQQFFDEHPPWILKAPPSASVSARHTAVHFRRSCYSDVVSKNFVPARRFHGFSHCRPKIRQACQPLIRLQMPEDDRRIQASATREFSYGGHDPDWIRGNRCCPSRRRLRHTPGAIRPGDLCRRRPSGDSTSAKLPSHLNASNLVLLMQHGRLERYKR